MKLYRNISTNELYRLFVDGEVNGKLHKSNQDTTYNPDEHGEVIFFFDYPAWLPYLNGYTILLEIETNEADIVGSGQSVYTQDLSHYEDNQYISVTCRKEVYLRKYTKSQVTKIWTQVETLAEAILNDIVNNGCLFIFNLYTTEADLSELSLEEMKREFDKINESDVNRFLNEVDENEQQEAKNLIYSYQFVKNHYDIIEKTEKDNYEFPCVMSSEGALKTNIIEKYSRKGAVVK